MTNILREVLEEQIQNTTRRDNLTQNEKLIQERWKEAKAFEFDAAEDLSKPKYFATFPYPYMNGRLHLGHMYTVSKADFMVYYQRMKGKQAIFPFSFHVTGMPIKACADKLKRELEIFGPSGPPPPTAEKLAAEKIRIKEELLKSMSGEEKEKSKGSAAPKEKKKSGTPGEFHSKKSKNAAKGNEEEKPQWDIMRSIGLSDDLIVKFTDANFWLEYFPPLCKDDLKAIGAGIDWRRSFYTTVANPYYDRFVRWQFNQLRAKNKVKFGNRYSIFSRLDGQPCMDHDRREGETVLPQEYTLIKMQIAGAFPEKLKPLEGKFDVFLAAATLRPETMYGQTNCWVLPTGEYGAYQINEREVFIISERAAINLSYQGLSLKPHETTCLLTVSGEDLLGVALKAPLSHYAQVYALPMLSIKMDKGTGVVTSVPSDSPDDFATLRDLKNKPALREKYGVKDEWVLPFDPVPILDTPMGDLCAEAACEMFKISSQNDREKLNEAKEHVYKLGFYESTMKVGAHAGKKVSDVKELIRDELLESGAATKYAEPASRVVSRSGDECIVALTDQWFLTYGEEEWREKTAQALARLETFSEETRAQFNHALGWLDQWACSRTYGLGSRVPWDEAYLIESLSDSTIYMAYYTIAHLLQGGDYEGSTPGPLGIRPEQLTDEVFDYVFLQKPYPEACGIPEESLAKLRREFEYWYPLDLRVSGKDLIPNHLTFMLYNHTAIWEHDESKWPRAVRGNGHLMLNAQKMAKQKGNFLTIADSLELFGADATRVALAHAGDGVDDANYASGNANKAVLDLYNGLVWAEEILASADLKDRPVESVEDRTFDSVMNKLIAKADQAYEHMLFHKALIYAFYELRVARDNYRIRVGADNMNRKLIERYIEVQALMMCPIAPHWAERVWTLLGRSGFAVHARFPEPGPVDEVLVAQDAQLWKLIEDFRKKLINTRARKQVASGTIYVATKYPEWHSRTVEIVAKHYDENNAQIDAKAITAILKSDPVIKKSMKVAVPLVKQISERVATEGRDALDLKMAYDEKEFLTSNQSFLEKVLEIPLSIVEEDGSQRVAAVPKIPTIYFN